MHHLPNLLTCLRVVLVLPIVWALLERQFSSALVLFAVAGVTDALDGFLARRFNWQSRLGAWLDPLADKLLLVSSFIVLAVIEALPWWLVLLVVIRDLVITLGAALYYWWRQQLRMQPLALGKLSTLLQVLCGFFSILQAAQLLQFTQWLSALVYLTGAVTLLSGLAYVVLWSQKFIATRADRAG